MPISPKEASAKNLKSVAEQLEKVCKRIDSSLSKQYYGDNTVTVSFTDLNERIVREIKAAYETAGWDVKYETSFHKNENCQAFKFSKQRYKSRDPRGI